MNARLVPVFGLLVACADSDEKDIVPPVIVEPDTEETAETGETEDTPDPPERDTGLNFVARLEGRAQVSPGVFLGYEALVYRWIDSEDNLSEPRCIYMTDVIDWAHDPTRFGAPDPYAHILDECPTCTFTFTVSKTNQAEVRSLPGDTDPPDTDPPDDDLMLSCEFLRDQGVLGNPDPEADSWFGYGFDPTLGDVNDPGSGALMVWDIINAVWVPYLYGVHLDAGEFDWSATVRQYTFTY